MRLLLKSLDESTAAVAETRGRMRSVVRSKIESGGYEESILNI
jgi:hypothetical protein